MNKIAQIYFIFIVSTDQKKSSKIHRDQYTKYVTFMAEHKLMRTGVGDKQKLQNLWFKLTDELNSISNGPKKVSADWQTTFSLWKTEVIRKAHKINSPIKGAGEGTSKKVILTDEEEAALRLWGVDFTRGKSTLDQSKPKIRRLTTSTNVEHVNNNWLFPTSTMASAFNVPQFPNATSKTPKNTKFSSEDIWEYLSNISTTPTPIMASTIITPSQSTLPIQATLTQIKPPTPVNEPNIFHQYTNEDTNNKNVSHPEAMSQPLAIDLTQTDNLPSEPTNISSSTIILTKSIGAVADQIGALANSVVLSADRMAELVEGVRVSHELMISQQNRIIQILSEKFNYTE